MEQARDAFAHRLAEADPENANLLLRHPVHFAFEELPFYRSTQLVRAFIELRHAPLQLSYVDGAGEVFALAGSTRRLEQFNERIALDLKPGQVAPYLRFFLANTSAGIDFRVVESADEIAWLHTARQEGHPAQRRAAEARKAIRPIAVVEVEGVYVATVTGIAQRGIRELTLDVTRSGHVRLVAHRLLVEDIPVPFLR